MVPRPTSFAELGVPEAIVGALHAARITQPFPIQAETIPDLLNGRDVIGRAPTGSGKTLAFGIPLVARAANGPAAQPKRPTGLVLAPTRELAAQIADELTPLLRATDRHGLAVYGGVGLGPQIKRLAKGVDLLVATPGRLEDLIEQRAVTLAAIETVVIDEADRMADMGFLPAVRRILDQTPRREQTVLYSATLDGEVARLTAEYQNNPLRHEVGDATPDLTKVEHFFWTVPRSDRIPLCASVVATFGRTIVFTRTRHGADRAARQLSSAGVNAVAIHGNRSQAQRERALADFASGRALALVATDVAARGIHVDAVECVVHFDPPDEDSAYVHRSGRTARAGARGRVVSFVDPSQVRQVKTMKRRLTLDQEITEPPEVEPLDGPLPTAPPAEPSSTGARQARDGSPRGTGGRRRGPKPRATPQRRSGNRPGAKSRPARSGTRGSSGSTHNRGSGGQDADSAPTGESKRNGPKQGGPKQGGPKQGGPKRNGPKQGGPKQGGPKRNGPKQGGSGRRSGPSGTRRSDQGRSS